ncbi:3-dehydroquinate synthase [Stomatohabitans albus]|uniref:3-dehydroquinate synthase n=1 Tax=Stomatohabitans albus TaxID=3110766 RepID=UPI00300CC30D
MTTIHVPLAGHEHTITVESGAIQRLGAYLPDQAGKVITVTNAYLHHQYGQKIAAGLADRELHTIIIDDGEANKTIEQVTTIWESLATIAAGRQDQLVAIGGGVIGDMAGFAGATYNRGMPVIQVPTTVLAMVDSSIGGKTGINLTAGKNLVGAFHQPAAVIIDPMVLATLDGRQRRAGLGEMAKYAYIADVRIADLLTTYAQSLAGEVRVPVDVYTELIARSAQIKVDHIVQDPFEHGIRAHLNYGHTIGHAIEQRCGYGTWLHGEAVGLGMIVAAQMGALLGMADTELVAHTQGLLSRLGLPTRLGQYFAQVAEPYELFSVLSRDKKNRPGETRFVLPIGLGQVEVVTNPDRQVILDALNILA